MSAFCHRYQPSFGINGMLIDDVAGRLRENGQVSMGEMTLAGSDTRNHRGTIMINVFSIQ